MRKTGAGRHSAIQAALNRRPSKKAPRRVTLSVSPEVWQRVRDCAVFERRSVVEVTEHALLEYVNRLEASQGEGFTYPPAPKKRSR